MKRKKLVMPSCPCRSPSALPRQAPISLQEWHLTAWKAKLLAQASIKAVSHPAAIADDRHAAQDMFDHLWKLGFRPEKR